MFKSPIGTSHCGVVYGNAFHLYVTLEIRHIVGVKVLNKNARLGALERKCQLLELEEYNFHAY